MELSEPNNHNHIKKVLGWFILISWVILQIL